ncbi:MAG: DEAD/DEAH box helicase [Gallionella sp.]|nr:DEAD/DEAH box helicase [Gallionella sp.]MDD4958131.1 DEAD/DEAH box helicase [Gallionella sp.]
MPHKNFKLHLAESIVAIADVILSRIGNFPGRSLLRKRYTTNPNTAPIAPIRLALERMSRETENSVQGIDGQDIALTNFQFELFETLDCTASVSVSAPTSAGKSFVMGMDLVRRLKAKQGTCVVYLVPTRALIREVANKFRKELRTAKMENVPVRTVPFPIEKEKAQQGAVYVLTQERLMSLLHSPQGKPWINTLVVDEAQNIQDGARGIILQSAVEAAIRRFPLMDVHFASPLIKNPEYLLNLFGRSRGGKPIIELISPVSQNLILVSEVYRKSNRAKFEVILQNERLDIGVYELDFPLRELIFVQRAALAVAITHDDESTILFANGATYTENQANAMVDQLKLKKFVSSNDPKLLEFIEFLREEIHPDYPLIQTLPYRVAFHYGKMPAIVRARVEDLFKEGVIKYVCCTSTLLQGVNLPARHIIIEKPKKGIDKPMQRRDFLNLAGRAGRLLSEFHGNVWCVRPSDWEDQCYQGEKLQEIHSAMGEVMADAGTAIQRMLDNEADTKEVDLAEAAFGKLYSDFVVVDRSIAESEFKTTENASQLELTAQKCQSIPISLPAEILDTNRAIRPDRLQALYDFLREQGNITEFLPLHPNKIGYYDVMKKIIHVLQNKLAGTDVENKTHEFYALLASKWIHNVVLKQILSESIQYAQEHSQKEISVPNVIRDTLGNIESIVRFLLVKQFIAYTSILAHILRERGEDKAAETIEPFHIYLECGASDRIALNLISVGFSRVTALAVYDKVSFPNEATPEDCLDKLSKTNINNLRIPKLCIREINDIFGR